MRSHCIAYLFPITLLLYKGNSTDTCHPFGNTLLTYARQFKPITIRLNGSISKGFGRYLQKIDTNCLRKQSNYQVFIAMILLKLYAYHEKCCGDGYDLNGMRIGSAKVIVDEFERMLGLKSEKIEFLNSFWIVNFIYSNHSLRNNPEISRMLKHIRYKPEMSQ